MASSLNNMTFAVGGALNTNSLTLSLPACLQPYRLIRSYAVQKNISARIQYFGTYHIRDQSEGSDDLFVCLVWFFTSLSQQLWSCRNDKFTLTTLFSWASLTKQVTSTSCTFCLLKLTTTLLESVEGRRLENIS